MRVLTIYAHPSPRSFCHAVLERFTKGLGDSGHTGEVVDLYAIGFDPVFRLQDFASYVHPDIPLEILEQMHLKQRVLDSAGGLLPRLLASLWLRGKDPRTIAAFIHNHRPKDVIAQWEKVRSAQGLAFIAPIYWLHFPAILKGWFKRVFAYGEAYALTPEGWRGQVKGRLPLLHHEKALVMNTAFFREEDYQAGLQLPMTRIIDDWGLRYPGVKKVEHVYLYAVDSVDDAMRRSYLERAYQLGRDFAQSSQ